MVWSLKCLKSLCSSFEMFRSILYYIILKNYYYYVLICEFMWELFWCYVIPLTEWLCYSPLSTYYWFYCLVVVWKDAVLGRPVYSHLPFLLCMFVWCVHGCICPVISKPWNYSGVGWCVSSLRIIAAVVVCQSCGMWCDISALHAQTLRKILSCDINWPIWISFLVLTIEENPLA